MYRPLPRFLLRAPLLPASAVWRGARALLRARLGSDAVQLASPSLARAPAGVRRDRALERYARRAAFRATPHGLLAGVCMGTLADRTAVATGTPAAYLAPGWARMEALARALLDDPALRARTRLRIAPSALRGVSVVRWLGPGTQEGLHPEAPFDEVHEADLVEPLPAILAAAERWVPWAAVRAAARTTAGDDDGDDDADELLLTLLDDGLLQSDLAPPIIGAAPGEHLRARLDALGEQDAARALLQANVALGDGQLARGAAGLASLPGGGEGSGVHAVLVHRPRKPPTLERAAVERAARLVPLLVRLQDALAAPAAERFAQPALAEALDAVTELHGGGAFDVAALATGDYGVELHGDDDDTIRRPPDATVLTLLLDAIAEASRLRRKEVTLDADALEQALRDVAGPRLPCSAELFLAPVPRRPRQPPGTGWLLGLHAPAGASLGRFGHALGADATEAMAGLEAAERRARPLEISTDVAFAPAPALTDLAARPKTSRRTLALSRWSQGSEDSEDSEDAEGELAPAALDLVADPDAPNGLALRERATGGPIVPASFSRLRSHTAPAGIARLLVGWSLWRQHASWAVPLGPLAELAYVPRLCLDGFVVAPASWRVPPGVRTPADIRRWRQAAQVPRHVQLGEGDELLPVDLATRGAAADLGDHDRVFEIWPPLDDIVDRDGRRLEAVVMLVEQPDADDVAGHARRSEAIRSAGAVPPPARAPGLAGWRTFKLFGAQGRQDDLLALLLPTVRAGQHAGEIDGWFFQRYIDGPGSRHHLRVRGHATGDAAAFAFEGRLRDRLRAARADAIVTSIEIDEYRPELGRFRADELAAVHDVFESDSELVCALLPAAADPLERIGLLVRALDVLAMGFGLDADARHALASARRRAAEAQVELDDGDRARADAAFRRVGRGLRAALAADGPGATAPHDAAAKLAAHHARTAHAARGLASGARTRLLPTLLHLAAVRALGADPDGERLAYTFWERTLQGLRRPAGRGAG